jgi:hypothetical protein
MSSSDNVSKRSVFCLLLFHLFFRDLKHFEDNQVFGDGRGQWLEKVSLLITANSFDEFQNIMTPGTHFFS